MSSDRKMIATEEQMKAARINIEWRDYCAHLLIPLNECRHKTFYMPWKCMHQRHEYEKCQYMEHLRDVARKNASKSDSKDE